MNKELLEKVANFNKLALEEISSLQSKIAEYEKEAEFRTYENDKLEQAVKKAADALYESDFLTDKLSYREFVKKAMADPRQLTKTIEKICAYKDVTNIGGPSSVTIKTSSAEEDPIYHKTFGGYSNSSSILED